MNTTQAKVAQALREIVEQSRLAGQSVRLGVMLHGSECGEEEVLLGARQAMRQNPCLRVTVFGERQEGYPELDWHETAPCEEECAAAIGQAIEGKGIQGAVAMHYPFPVGVTTIGKIRTPARGRPLYIASSTGTSALSRVEALTRNTLYGIAVAKAAGITNPTVGLLNQDGASGALRVLETLSAQGYAIPFGQSLRKEGGRLLRGNDLVAGSVDIAVCDTLTGNALCKVFSTFTSGGLYESAGWGYGPSVGEGWEKVISIVSRSSGAGVIAGALLHTAEMVKGNLPFHVREELAKAQSAGLAALLKTKHAARPVSPGAAKLVPCIVDESFGGVDVLELEAAIALLAEKGIYAEGAMGCTGPIVRVAAKDREGAMNCLKENGYL